MSRLTPVQRQIVENLTANLCVTSGAGCGKTSVLVERYIRYLEQDLALRLLDVAAITFTENAAAEMRDRIRRACRAQVEAARQANDRRRMEIWLARYWDVDIAPIDTIHSFCSALLHRYPIEARVDPNFTLLDETEAALLRTDVVAAAFEELLEKEDADLLAVLEHFSLTQGREMFVEIVGEKREVLRRVTAPVMDRSDDEIVAALRQAVGELAQRLLGDCLASPAFSAAVSALASAAGKAGDKREQLRQEALAQVERLRRARTADIAQEAAAWLAGINLRGGSARQWPSEEAFGAAGEALKTLREAIREATGALPVFDAETEKRHVALARAFYRVACRLIDAYEAAKRERAAMDFEDLQIRARDMLKTSAQVLEDCRQRFRAILVDELQDTNLLQFEIVDLLVRGPAGRRKEPVLRPGAFFGVGDPKQSIYRFRGAELEVFEQALDRVGPAGRKTLSESFRLHTGTAALANHIFPGLMRGYEPIEGQREQKNAAVGECLVVLDPEHEPLDTVAGHTEEAVRLAARLSEIVTAKAVAVQDRETGEWRPARYGDVAILLRRTIYLHLYEEALERRGVPYYVVAGAGFYKQQEVLDVVHLLRVLDDPADDLHLAGVLRSPFFAVSDEGLFHLRALGRTLHDALGAAAKADRLNEEDRRGLGRAATLLPQWAAAKDRVGLGRLVDLAVFESGYAAASVGRFGGARAYANLRQMAELARQFERHGLYALGDYIEYVTDFMQGEMRMEQAPIEAPGGDTVRLMTIHKAKGLEFPVVAVPDLAYGPRGSRSPYFIHPVTGLAVRMRDEEGERAKSGAMALAAYDDAAAQRDETWRLFYVALTRARDYLVLSSHDSSRARPEDSWLEAILQGLGADRRAGDQDVRLPTGQVLRVSAQPPQDEKPGHGRRRGGPRDVFAAGRVLWDRLHDRGAAAKRRAVEETLGRVTPAPLAARPPSRIAATALATYSQCPRLYGWTHVLGVDQPEPAPVVGGLSPLKWGVLAHRVLELAMSADEVCARMAVDGALREAEAGSGAAREALRRRLAEVVRTFWATPLGARVSHARQVYREMPFLFMLDNTEIHGSIDLLLQGSDGLWELVDYKTAASTVDASASPQSTYGLQLGIYALAAGRWLGRPVARWSVYLLGAGTVAAHEASASDFDCVRARVREALAGMADGLYDCRSPAGCLACRFNVLCGRGMGESREKPRRGAADDLRLLNSEGAP